MTHNYYGNRKIVRTSQVGNETLQVWRFLADSFVDFQASWYLPHATPSFSTSPIPPTYPSFLLPNPPIHPWLLAHLLIFPASTIPCPVVGSAWGRAASSKESPSSTKAPATPSSWVLGPSLPSSLPSWYTSVSLSIILNQRDLGRFSSNSTNVNSYPPRYQSFIWGENCSVPLAWMTIESSVNYG